jgi:hypothetical protein
MKNKYFISPSGYLISEGLVQDILNEQDDAAMLAAMKKAATSQSSTTSTASAKPVGGKFIENPTEANLEKDRKTFVAIAQKWVVSVNNRNRDLFDKVHKWYDGESAEYTNVWYDYQVTFGWDRAKDAAEEVLGSAYDGEENGKWGIDIASELVTLISGLKENMKLYSDASSFFYTQGGLGKGTYEDFLNMIKRGGTEGRDYFAKETGILTNTYQKEYFEFLRGCYYISEEFWKELHATLKSFTITTTFAYANKKNITLWSCTRWLKNRSLVLEIIPSGFGRSPAAITLAFFSPF